MNTENNENNEKFIEITVETIAPEIEKLRAQIASLKKRFTAVNADAAKMQRQMIANKPTDSK